jgi:hypothetical protein
MCFVEYGIEMKEQIDSLARFRGEFERVRNQVLMGNAHLELWLRLSKRLGSDPKRLAANAAPTFFGMTLESHLNTAFLYAARIFDTHRDALTLRTILVRASNNRGSLSAVAAVEIDAHIKNSEGKFTELEASLRAVRTRRDKVLAHLDPKVLSEPDEVAKESEITVDELQKIFVVAWEILNGVSDPYWGLSASLKLIDVDDYETALDLIEAAKKRQLAEIEAKFGPIPDPL